jgi:hypothetical protein
MANAKPLDDDPLDVIADAPGSSTADIKVFKDVHPAADGKLHLALATTQNDIPFVNAIEIAPSEPGSISQFGLWRGKSGIRIGTTASGVPTATSTMACSCREPHLWRARTNRSLSQRTCRQFLLCDSRCQSRALRCNDEVLRSLALARRFKRRRLQDLRRPVQRQNPALKLRHLQGSRQSASSGQDVRGPGAERTGQADLHLHADPQLRGDKRHRSNGSSLEQLVTAENSRSAPPVKPVAPASGTWPTFLGLARDRAQALCDNCPLPVRHGSTT